MPVHHKVVLPECESPSNTESDRDPNTDELPSKPADGENDLSRKSVAGLARKSSDEEPAAGEGLSEEVYEVEKILDHDETKEGLFYLVHWKGFTDEDDSWEPVENLVFATKAIAEYEASKKFQRSRKGKKSRSESIKTPKAKSENSYKKGSSTKSSTTSSKSRSRQKASVEKSESEPEPDVPSDDIEDEDFTEKAKSTKKTSAPLPKGSGTVTKAALKSYSPTTPKASRCSTSSTSYISPAETMSAAKKDFEEKPDQMQALLTRQSWLYDSDSDDDSGTEKENEKRTEQRKQLEEEQERIREENEKREQKEAKNVTEEPPRSKDRKRKAEEFCSDQKKKTRSDVPEKHEEDANSVMVSEKHQNGEKCPSVPPAPPTYVYSTSYSATVPSTSTDNNAQGEVQIFAIGKVNDGRIRVVIGNDQAKKVVSLRDAHDANSWGLLQHLLQYAVFDDFDD